MRGLLKNMNNSDYKCAISLNKLRATIVALLMFVMMAPVANATRYITFNDGRLYVFPNNCMLSLAIRDGFIVITDRHGGIYSYSLDDILSIDTELTKELPTFSTYLFDNKYNYQVPTDAVGTITSNTVNVIVSGIGKRLTASFSLSDNAARAYVDGWSRKVR